MGCAASGPVAVDAPAPPPTTTTALALPRVTERLPDLEAGWESWGVDEMLEWARHALRSRPGQSAVAIMVLSETNGTALQLLCETTDPGTGMTSGAELRLQHGSPRFAALLDGALQL